ncbi:MAG TPA: DNA primase [Thermoanaerobaculia bacterium]|nr:DNA primase [Thermoanaerobaculia bacterium]
MAVPLDPGFVQAVREAVDLLDLVADHSRLEARGKRHIGICPFHKEKTPSFSVDPQQGLYYCFGCGAGGDAIGFHMQVTGDDFGAAIESLAQRYGVPLPDRRGRAAAESDRAGADALEAAERFFRAELARREAPRRYLERRRIDPQLQRDYGLGYAPDDWQALHEALRRNFADEVLAGAGLIATSDKGRRYDRFRHRLMFPIRSPTGRLVGFGGRTLGDDPAKYVNTPETSAFRKGTLLYGLDRVRAQAREDRRLVLVEGYFDVLAVVASGIPTVVASMGTALTSAQAKLLARYADEVIVGYDGDRAGEEASRKALPTLLQAGLAVRRARFPAGQDPDSLRLDEGEAAVQERIEGAPDFLELVVSQLPAQVADRPRELQDAVDSIRPLLAAVADPSQRVAYQRRVAERLGVRLDLLGTRAAELFAPRRPAARGDSAPAVADSDTPGRYLEEGVLRLLLSTPLEIDALPPAEVFWSSARRQLYEAIVAASRSTPAGDVVGVRDVQSRLEPASEAVTILARLGGDLPESPAASHRPELLNQLELMKRQRRHSRRQLAREMWKAQEAGDLERLEELKAETQELFRQRRQDHDGRAEEPKRS